MGHRVAGGHRAVVHPGLRDDQRAVERRSDVHLPLAALLDRQRGELRDIPTAGAVHTTYAPVAGDVGSRLRVVVTATQYGQSAPLASAVGPVVQPATTTPTRPVTPPRDTTAPNTSITSRPPASTGNPTATFRFTANEAVASFHCRMDKRPLTACSPGIAYRGLAVGRHTFKVAATDKAGNVDPTSAIYSFTVARPQTRVTKGPRATTTDRTATFSFGSSQGRSSFRCALDGARPGRCRSPGPSATSRPAATR